MSFLELEGKKFLVFGVANRKSIAYHVGQVLKEAEAEVLYAVKSREIKEVACKFLPAGSQIYVCDVAREGDIERLAAEIRREHSPLAGLVHSIAFANYSQGVKPFHETAKGDFLQAVDISCYSLIHIARAFSSLLEREASVVTMSISTTRMAAESYGYMGPVKAALDSTVCFLAKSFSTFSRIRFNAVGAGLLKTSASAGIPEYIDSYLFAEQLTLRKKALATREVANVVAFLLSSRSSGINAQTLIVDAGMSVNYFDKGIIKRALRNFP
ncbi:MAG: SDR family oxidoreductase [bacterium]|nr:SDR family oxidoreductase [bacterium]